MGIDLIIETHSLSELPLALIEYLEGLGITALMHARNILAG